MSLSEISTTVNDCWNQEGVWGKLQRNCPQLKTFGHCRNCTTYSVTGRRLLARPLSQEYREELNQLYSTAVQEEKKLTRKAFIFRTGTDWLGIKNSLINEVVDMGPIHSIPHKSSRIFRGIVNIRGRLELCVSIGGVLKIDPGPKAHDIISPERLIVATKAGQSVVFPVSEVLGPVPYEVANLNPLPITVSGSKAVYTKGILSLEDKDVGLLDETLLFRILTRNLA